MDGQTEIGQRKMKIDGHITSRFAQDWSACVRVFGHEPAMYMQTRTRLVIDVITCQMQAVTSWK